MCFFLLVSYMPLAGKRGETRLSPALALEAVTTAMFRSQLDTSSLIPISSDMVDKSDEETVEEETLSLSDGAGGLRTLFLCAAICVLVVLGTVAAILD